MAMQTAALEQQTVLAQQRGEHALEVEYHRSAGLAAQQELMAWAQTALQEEVAEAQILASQVAHSAFEHKQIQWEAAQEQRTRKELLDQQTKLASQAQNALKARQAQLDQDFQARQTQQDQEFQARQTRLAQDFQDHLAQFQARQAQWEMECEQRAKRDQGSLQAQMEDQILSDRSTLQQQAQDQMSRFEDKARQDAAQMRELEKIVAAQRDALSIVCLLYTSPSPRDS